jgi:small subunit ribosomal protein S15
MALFQLGRRALVPELLARWRGSCAGMATGSGEPVRGASQLRSRLVSSTSPCATPAVDVPERARMKPSSAGPPLTGTAQPELLAKYLSQANMSGAEQTRLALAAARERVARHPSDSGSSEVQVSVFTWRISALTSHLRAHPKDKHSRRGLMAVLSARRKLLQYLRRTEPDTYSTLIKTLSLKDVAAAGTGAGHRGSFKQAGSRM